MPRRRLRGWLVLALVVLVVGLLAQLEESSLLEDAGVAAVVVALVVVAVALPLLLVDRDG